MTITLIPQTEQEAFDSVWNQLKRQTSRAFNGNICVYREGGDAHSPNRCAVGGMIPDEQYDPAIEGQSVMQLRRDGEIFTKIDLSLLSNLQDVHDYVCYWNVSAETGQETLNDQGWKRLRTLAKDNGLTVPA